MERLLADHLLSVLVFLPVAGALLLLLVPRSAPGATKVAALAVATLEALLSLPLWWHFDVAQKGFQFRESAPWIQPLGISY